MTISLEALQARVSKNLETAEELNRAKQKAKQAKSDSERLAANAEAADLASRIDWLPKALVLRFDRWECACGEHGRAPMGLFIYSEHTRLANASRIALPRHESSDELNRLPRKTQEVTRAVALCPVCAAAKGFITATGA